MATTRTQQPMSAPARPLGVARRMLGVEPLDWALSTLYLCVSLGFIIREALTAQPFPWAAAALLIVTSLALGGLDCWERLRYGLGAMPAGAALALLALRLALVELANWIDGSGASVFLYLTIPFSIAMALGMRAGWFVGALVWLRFIVKIELIESPGYMPHHKLEDILVFPAAIAFVLAMAGLMRAERAGRRRSERLLEELEASHRQLTSYASQVEELTISAERSRLAREIHDSLGHYLTAINVQLRKASAFRTRDPQQADQALSESTRLTHAALEDVRRSVSWLRTSDQIPSLATGLRQLVAPFEGDAPSIAVTVEGSEEGFARGTLLALYRAAQEGLTNVQRHARAERVTLALRFDDDQVTLEICDDGEGFDAAAMRELPAGRGERYGLQGIHERMALVGGAAQIDSRPGHGTRLTLHAPRELPGERARDIAQSAAQPSISGPLAWLLGCDEEARRE